MPLRRLATPLARGLLSSPGVHAALEHSAEGWGRFPRAAHFHKRLVWSSDALPAPVPGTANPTVLAYGQGRSYGDACLNDQGTLLLTAGLDRVLGFDPAQGILRCEAGITLAEILRLFMPRGWFPPVVPGTQFVSVGGAVANDIHGKNHHRAGTFGSHVLRLELVRSSGERLVCSPSENAGLFRATIGGLGLTGLISWVELQLAPVETAWIDVETIKLEDLDQFFEVSNASDTTHAYTVAWLDCLAAGSKLGRGLFMRGNHLPRSALPAGLEAHPSTDARARVDVPLDAPGWALNPLTLRAFNFAYYNKQLRRSVRARQHYRPFFFPLDAVHRWNRLYGKRGFLQWQCVVPIEGGAIRTVLEQIARAGKGSFLAVLKTFGSVASPGLLSFPRPGATLALDFPNDGKQTFDLLDRLDAIVRGAGGAVYPAKDARMSPEDFRRFFPRWAELAEHVDPGFSSSLWRRVAGAR